MKPDMMRITVVAAALFILISGRSYADNMKAPQIYPKFDVKAYNEPNFDSQQVEQIPSGTSLEVISSESAWVKVRTPKNAEGWLARKWVTESKEDLAKAAQQKKQRTVEKINELEAKAKATPPAEVYDIRNIYKELAALSPDNAEYQKILASIDKEIKKTVNFRQTRWGMSQKEVLMAEEGQPKHRSEDLLTYTSVLDGKDVDIVYIFAANSLVRAKYLLTERHTNKNDYIADYRALKTLLSKKYGKPDSDKHFWKNSLYERDSQNEGLAISIGHLTHYAQWKTTPNDIGIIITGDNYQINCSIEYVSNDLRGRESKAKEARTLENI